MRLAYLLAAGVLAFASAAAAQEAPPQQTPVEPASGPEVSFNAAITSDYVYRGISQTDEEPAIQLGVDATFGQAYVGAWASTVDFGDDTQAELDLYAGIKPEVAGWTVDLGAIYYGYLGQPDDANWDYFELKAAASRAFGPATIGAAAFWSPEFTGETGNAWYTELNGAYDLGNGLSFTGAVGRQTIDVGGDYTTWNLGGVLNATDNVVLDLRYWDTDIDGLSIADERLVLTVKFVG